MWKIWVRYIIMMDISVDTEDMDRRFVYSEGTDIIPW